MNTDWNPVAPETRAAAGYRALVDAHPLMGTLVISVSLFVLLLVVLASLLGLMCFLVFVWAAVGPGPHI